MAASAIPPTRPGLIGAGLTVEKPTGFDAEQAAVFLAPAAGHPDRTFVVGENFLHRDDLRHARALLDAGVRHIAEIRLLRADTVPVNGVVQAAARTIDAPWDLTHNRVFTCGARLLRRNISSSVSFTA